MCLVDFVYNAFEANVFAETAMRELESGTFAVVQAVADGQACSISSEGVPDTMLYGGSNLADGWESAIREWLSGGSSYDFSNPGHSGGRTLFWSQVSATDTSGNFNHDALIMQHRNFTGLQCIFAIKIVLAVRADIGKIRFIFDPIALGPQLPRCC